MTRPFQRALLLSGFFIINAVPGFQIVESLGGGSVAKALTVLACAAFAGAVSSHILATRGAARQP